MQKEMIWNERVEDSKISSEAETPNLKVQPVEELSQPIEQDSSAQKFSCEVVISNSFISS